MSTYIVHCSNYIATFVYKYQDGTYNSFSHVTGRTKVLNLAQSKILHYMFHP